VRGEKARPPSCMGSAYASQITCVDDVVHAGRSSLRVVGGQAVTPASLPSGWMAPLKSDKEGGRT